VPLEHVLAIVARENGKGMAFTSEAEVHAEAGSGGEAPGTSDVPGNDEPPSPPAGPDKPRSRPTLKVVK
jgi:stringent starvation protein B